MEQIYRNSDQTKRSKISTIVKYTMEIDRLLSKVLFGSPPNTTKKKESIITIRVPRIIPWTNTKERNSTETGKNGIRQNRIQSVLGMKLQIEYYRSTAYHWVY